MRYQSPLNVFTDIFIICLFFSAGCAGKASDKNKTEDDQMATQSKSDIQGAWELVSSKSNDKIDNPGKTMQLKILCNGFFCYLMLNSSTGKWSEAGGGTYETDGKTYKEVHQYNANPKYVGFTDWQEFKIEGDTLYMTLFTKALNGKGEDVTSQWPRIVEKRIRARK